jgi:hypothetical protein
MQHVRMPRALGGFSTVDADERDTQVSRETTFPTDMKGVGCKDGCALCLRDDV